MVGKLVSSRFVCRDIACKLQVNISRKERQKLLSLEISSCQSWNAISLCYHNSCKTTILLMSYFSYFEGKTMSSSKFYLFDSLGLRFSVSFFCVFFDLVQNIQPVTLFYDFCNESCVPFTNIPCVKKGFRIFFL